MIKQFNLNNYLLKRKLVLMYDHVISNDKNFINNKFDRVVDKLFK